MWPNSQNKNNECLYIVTQVEFTYKKTSRIPIYNFLKQESCNIEYDSIYYIYGCQNGQIALIYEVFSKIALFANFVA